MLLGALSQTHAEGVLSEWLVTRCIFFFFFFPSFLYSLLHKQRACVDIICVAGILPADGKGASFVLIGFVKAGGPLGDDGE